MCKPGYLATIQDLSDIQVISDLLARNNAPASAEIFLGGPVNLPQLGVGIFNVDATMTNPSIPDPQVGNVATISAGDSQFSDLSEAFGLLSLGYVCKSIYYDNGKIFFSTLNSFTRRDEADCGENGKLVTFDQHSANKVTRITKELSLKAFGFSEILYHIGATYDAETMELAWDDGTRSTVRNWCSNPPSVDNPNNLDPVPDQCVVVTSTGCWELQRCFAVLPTPPLGFICDADQRGIDLSERNQMLTMVKVLQKKIAEIKAGCQSCAKRH
ncbi:uncharacterized protein [Clytia hemisphaerica]